MVTLTGAANCSRCDCERTDQAGHDEQTVTDQSTTDGAVQESGRGAHRRYSGTVSNTTERSSGGVGNAKAETGVNPNETADGKDQNTRESVKPGTIGTRTTRAAGTGTSNGRPVN